MAMEEVEEDETSKAIDAVYLKLHYNSKLLEEETLTQIPLIR